LESGGQGEKKKNDGKLQGEWNRSGDAVREALEGNQITKRGMKRMVMNRVLGGKQW